MKVHFISIGGAVMHNLAIQLHKLGHMVTGSDDEIYDPARSRLAALGLLPEEGWDAGRIHDELDLVLLGMHAREDNTELGKAQQLGLTIQSFPEFIAEHARDKTRVVIAGSHGKTTTTAMIMHVLQEAGRVFDFLVGASLEGFEDMVRLSDAPLIVIEGDEYLSSAIDNRPKFLHYDPDILVVTGIAWDHMNVFPTEENYIDQFSLLLESCREGSRVFYDCRDQHLLRLISSSFIPSYFYPYLPFECKVQDGGFELRHQGRRVPLQVFGTHNLANLKAAYKVCRELEIPDNTFFKAIRDFRGASKRMEVLLRNDRHVLIRDFAHAPSKVRATLQAVRELYPTRHIIAVAELHTYSSLNKEFLPHYKGTMAPADLPIVFFNPHTLKMKRMPPINMTEVRDFFGVPGLIVSNDADDLYRRITEGLREDSVVLLMSSGVFGGLDLSDLTGRLAS